MYMTSTARDTVYHVFRREFVVPTGATPLEGLALTMIDRDRPTAEVIGNVRVGRGELVGTAPSSQPRLVLSDPAGGLLLLLGVNDTEPHSNTGQLQFSIRVRPLAPSEWMNQQTGPCGSWERHGGHEQPHQKEGELRPWLEAGRLHEGRLRGGQGSSLAGLNPRTARHSRRPSSYARTMPSMNFCFLRLGIRA